MRSAVIVEAVRTPIGKRNGRLSGWHPAELAGAAIGAALERSQIDPDLVEDVIVGCVSQVGAQSTNIARSALLAGGLPESVPGTTVDRQCGSSQQALHFAAQGVVAGAYDVVVAAGVECMSTVPMFSNADPNLGDPYGPVLHARYSDRETVGFRGIVPQGISAEWVADNFHLDRPALDAFALKSHARAAHARDTGRFRAELVPVEARTRDPNTSEPVAEQGLLAVDEGIRSSSMEALALLKPVFVEGGCVTAGNSSQISDGAAALVIVEERRASVLGLRPLARFVDGVVVATDPVTMLTAPIPATERLLLRTGLTIDDVDLFEVSEAFAPVVLSWHKAVGADLERVNVHGGAIALGHPLGASGSRLMTTLVHALQATGGRYGLQTMCEGGGMANATLVERLS